MANDFMKNINKKVLDGEVVSLNKTFPNVEVAKPTEEIVEEKPAKKGKKAKEVEPIVEETVKDEVVEETPTEETVEESATDEE